MTLRIAITMLVSAVAGSGSVANGAEPIAGKQPQCAVATDGKVYLTFGRDNDVYCATSRDQGVTFDTPVKVGTPGELSLGMRRGPRIAVAGSTVVVTAIGGPLGKGKDGDIQAWRSTDAGATWSKPVRANDVESSAREGLHGMAASAKGELACAWLDLRTKGSKVYVATSGDGGATWGKNVLAYETEGGVCPCCHPSVAYDTDGNLLVLWRNALSGTRDMFYTVSKDHGRTFSAATKLGEGSWKLNVCPMDGGMIVGGKSDQVASIWRRDKQIFATGFSSGDRKEQLLGTGEQPWLAQTPKGVVGVWLAKRGGDLMLWRGGPLRAEIIAEEATDPVIAANPTGKGPVVVCWETGVKQSPRIAWQVVH